ncbi:MAG: 3-dehydroquinate synthase [Oscillospiraceae bacterium]|nr:3-dehydroquinate synthase [Oscillospiraceae bacterium]
METITVNASVKYDVIIGGGLLECCGGYIKNVTIADKIAVISDDNVSGIYLDRVKKSLTEAGFEVHSFIFPHGETSKCSDTLNKIYGFLAMNHFTRTDCIAALGGGVTGDMAGYASATYLRGMDFVQLPTSLLAQVDSSVGGKTAIDIPEGKNLVGAFKQPKLVLCDTDALRTLPKDFLIDGMGEVVKYAMIKSAPLFDILMKHDIDSIWEVMEDIITRCVTIKRDVVEADEFDKGERMLLNFGHTLGHSIEQYYHYTGISHGRAVAKGMEMITFLSEKKNLCRNGLTDQLLACLKKYCLDISVEPEAKDLGGACLNDKKRAGSCISVIICSDIGVSSPVKMTVEDFDKFLK